MKRYIRTKKGNIFDTKGLAVRYYEFGIVVEFDNANILFDDKDIVKYADTIEELIEVGDLVKDNESSCVLKEQEAVEYIKQEKADFITELYTKQGNDYILVAKKENGEWRVI